MKIIKADLFDFPDGITLIAHSVSCDYPMGSGIAKQIKDRYPEAYAAHASQLNSISHRKNLLGFISTAELSPGKFIANLYTQLNDGANKRQVDYEAFYSSLELLNKAYPECVIGLPHKISCDLAGGNWKIISAIIEVLEEKRGKEYIICHP